MNKISNDLYKKINSPYKRGDALIYIILLFLVFILFFLSTITPKKDGNGFRAEINNEVVFEYNFDNNIATIIKAENIEKIDDYNYKIFSIYGYNLIKIIPEEKNCIVTDANCSFSKECKHMSLKNGEIICVPHRLIIKLTGQTYSPKVG